MKTIVTDECSYIRAAMAESLLSLSPVLGRQVTSEQILGLYLTLLRDDNADVRINIFGTFNYLTKVLPPSSLVGSIIPVFVELANHRSWKIKVKALESVVEFEKQLGTDFISDKGVLVVIAESLSDRVYSVR